MPYRQQAGNTAVEYTLLAAFVAVAAIASLSTMGNSVSHLLAQPAEGASKNVMEEMVSLNFGTNGDNASSSGKKNSAAEMANTGAPLGLTRSGGTNATSTDGKTIMAMIQAAFARAARLEALAEQTEENELADWYRETSRYAYRLAGSQATFSYYDNPEANTGLKPLLEPNLNKGDAIRSIYEMQKEITKKVDQISKSNSVSETGKQEAISLASQILSGLHAQYGTTLAKYSDGNKNLKLQEVKRDFGGGDRQYQRENLKPIAAEVLKQGTARQSVALEASLQNGIVMDSKASEIIPE